MRRKRIGHWRRIAGSKEAKERQKCDKIRKGRGVWEMGKCSERRRRRRRHGCKGTKDGLEEVRHKLVGVVSG